MSGDSISKQETADPCTVNLKQGYLEKQSRRLRLWQRRFFELGYRPDKRTALLKYYDSEDKFQIRGEVAFSPVKFSVDKLDNLHTFILQLPHRKYVFRHQDHNWVKQFQMLDQYAEIDKKAENFDNQIVHQDQTHSTPNEHLQQTATEFSNSSDVSDISSIDYPPGEESYQKSYAGQNLELAARSKADQTVRMDAHSSLPLDMSTEIQQSAQAHRAPPVPLIIATSHEPEKAPEFHSSGKSFHFRAATK
eukprot:762423-Hanusia_phi.AAC.2